MNATKMLRAAAFGLAALLILVLLGWAFLAYRDPDRVADFASFVQLCFSVVGVPRN